MQRAARSATRILLLKPFVWRLLDVRVHGVDRLANCPDTFVVVGNHASHLDAPLIFGGLPGRLSKYLSTGAAADYFFTKWYTAAYTSLMFNAFPIERGSKSTSDDKKKNSRRGLAAALLADGVPILLFAEGTRSRTGAMGPFKPGAAALAISRNVPVVPVALVGAYAAWPHHQNHLPKGRPPVHVVFGEPMFPVPGEIAHKFNERVRRRVIELHDTTARAYGMKTLAEYARTVAIEKMQAQVEAGKPSPTTENTTKTDDKN
ncbi:lysophospholipid acyltransferase family protein [Aestuariimicrobium soli]|uniref:lysophospholipid acyltransferase family protein n=1 Tax=Aestuariimicrobium soli TaxID=2035834 RepID=UPI003EC03124